MYGKKRHQLLSALFDVRCALTVSNVRGALVYAMAMKIKALLAPSSRYGVNFRLQLLKVNEYAANFAA